MENDNEPIILGAQLYSVRTLFSSDEETEHTLKALKEMGYESVQVSGFQFDAEKISEYTKKLGLSVGLTHTPIPEIIENTDEVIKKHKILNAPMVGVGAPVGYMEDGIIDIERFMAEIQDAVKKIQDAGLLFGYHNHYFEFKDLGGFNAMDVFIDQTDWNFILDTGWAYVSDVDCPTLIKRIHSRMPYIHLKDFKKDVGDDGKTYSTICSVGEGFVDFELMLAPMKESGTLAVYVEQDNAADKPEPLYEMKKSYEYIKERKWFE